ncbi:membrane protein insertase YidC [Sediminibacterium roseum]|uniref:Membrane protein insertase YidC n=1 Tax=Sediminibacterium roseum TaxID=1978412 RepID=A0ABW9ZQ88_9BACT|nr:membrane protein insertase YidC [Sediminibacterium roseum]NCI49262.1 membrane protein insertase YidC [Sediminibacterium roseum]
MKTDKNTVIGFVLLGLLFFVYFWYSNKTTNEARAFEQHKKDSLEKIRLANIKPQDTIAARIDSLKRDSISRISSAGDFQTAALGTEQLVTIENSVIKVTFTSKGGQVKQVELKNYKSAHDGKPIVLSGSNQLGYSVNTSANVSTQTSALYFNAAQPMVNADKSQTVNFTLTAPNGESITHQYVLKEDAYMLDWNVSLTGADKLLSQGQMNVNWHAETFQAEKQSDYERTQSNITFSEGGSFDYISAKTERKFEEPVQWIGMVQQFFNSTLIAKNSFNSGQVTWSRKTDSSKGLATADAAMQIKVPVAGSVSVPFQMYYGPNDYSILKKQAPEMDKIVNLGRDMYAFVRPINKYIIMNVFDFFAKFVKNYGWVVLLLTLFIRLVTAPLTYKSYLSGAKMKVLRPELDEMKKKFGDDKQGFAMAQMKLFREGGVSALGGCIPALLQIPIFFALYSFFNSNIALRGQEFLWSHDLSSYDSIAHLPFSIPGYGDHVSLFTITAVLTSFLISIYNMNMTPTQDNPALKYMPYIFPFMLLFIFNKLPSALTWYYTVSNIVTLGLQFVIQNYIINHDKILADIEAKRKAPKTKSKWQERYDQMMESQKKLQEMKDKQAKKK